MNPSNSAPPSQKHCKKQLASFFSSDSSSSSSSISNAKVEVSINNYTVSKPSINPPEMSTTCLPTVSKHIKETLQQHNQPTYDVQLLNTSKSVPIQTKLGTYFKAIANKNIGANPALRQMKYNRSQAMFRLSARITKSNLGIRHSSLPSLPSSLPSTPNSSHHDSSTVSPKSSLSPLSFWSHSSTDSSISNPHDAILRRDEVDSVSNRNITSVTSPFSEDSSTNSSASLFTPPSLHHRQFDPMSHRITRARTKALSQTAAPVASQSPLPLSTQSPVLLLPVLNDLRSDREPSIEESRSLLGPHADSSHQHEKASSKLERTVSLPVQENVASIDIPSSSSPTLNIPSELPTAIPHQELSRVQQLLMEISSNTSTVKTLRSEYEQRRKFIDATIEELTLSSTHSNLTTHTTPLHQSIASMSTTCSVSEKIHTSPTLSRVSSFKCQATPTLNFTDPPNTPTYTSCTEEASCSTSHSRVPTSLSIPSEINCENPSHDSFVHVEDEECTARDTNTEPAKTLVDHILDDRFITQASDSSSTITHSGSKQPSTSPPQQAPHSQDESPLAPNTPPTRDSAHTTMHLSVSQDAEQHPIVTPVVSGKLDTPVNKKKHSIRIIAQNCRGAFHSSTKHSDFYIPSMESLQGYSPDVICLCETNTDWKVRDNGYEADLMNRAIWNPAPTKTVVANCVWKNLQRTTYQPGGVLTVCANSMPSRIKTTFRDPYGRFVKIVYQAKGNRDVAIYNIYRPNPGSTTTSGINTVWMQQWRSLRDQHVPCDPRALCILHLIDEIQKDLEKNIHPILVGDFNEDFNENSEHGLRNLMTSCNIVQVYKELVGFIPSSRHNNRSVFHVFVYQPLLKYVLKTGILPSEIGFHTSDHIPFFVDFHQDLFNYKELPIVSPNLRKLKMYDSPNVEKYICYIKDQMHHHNILQRFLNLQDYIKIKSFDESAEIEIELLDSQMTQIRLRAEKRLCPDPSRFKNASKMQIQVHKIRHLVSIQKFWKAGLDFSHLVRELRSYGLENTNLTSLIKLQERISQERLELKFLHEEEDVVRIDHLDYLHEKAIEIQNKKKATIIKNMKMRESQKRSWAKIRYVTKQSSNHNVERLGIPKGFENKSTEAIWDYLSSPSSKPTFIYINDPDEIEKRLIEWQYCHYGQAKETPLSSVTWHEKLDPLQKSNEEMDEVMTGDIFKESDLPDESKDFLRHMTSNVQPEMNAKDYEISESTFRNFYSKAKESTSSSPSGLHLGHWKAGAEDKDICKVLAGLVRIAVQNTYTLKRWRKVVSILMEKVKGSPTIHKFRTIHLLESDMNFILRYIWGRQFMRHNESNKAWHENQYGSRKGIQGQSATLNKVLTLDIVRYYAEPAAIVDNDAKACYDRMIPVVLSYALIRLGLPKKLTRFMCRWLEEATYFIKTSKGISKHKYGSTLQSYLFGTGQGTGWSPPNWGAISDLISTVMSANTPGMKLVHPNGKFCSDRSFDAFVDDVNGGLTSDGLHTFQPSPASHIPILSTIYEQIQVNIQYYSRLLFTSGGKLALDKCRAFLLEFEWKNGIRYMTRTADVYDDLQLDQAFTGTKDTIKLLNPNEARKMLGAYTAPDGNTKVQFEVLHKISCQWGQRVSNGYLNRFDVQNSFKLGLIPALQYPLGVGTLSEKQCDSLLIPSMSTLLNKMGVIRTVNRDVVHGPSMYGGFAIPNLYTIQGYNKIQMMLGHIRKMDTTGKIVTIAIATVQQEVGISLSILSLPFSKFHFLVSPCWIKEVWRFLDAISGTFRFSNDWTPPPTYERDINIMEVVLSWDLSDAKKSIINMCRLYLKVYYLGDLYETNGRRMKYHILHFKDISHHDDKFPSIQLPKSYKEHWNYAIKRFAADYPPASQLGPLLHSKSFRYRMTKDMHTIYAYSKRERTTYCLSPSLWKELAYAKVGSFKSASILQEEHSDYYAVTVDLDAHSGKLRLRHFKKIDCKVPPPPLTSPYRLNILVDSTSLAEMEKFTQIVSSYGPSIVRNIGQIKSKLHLRQLALALQNGSLIGVGDASVALEKIGHAYILESKPAKYSMSGVAPVDCVVEDQTSNRGESFTVLALCTLIHALCRTYNLNSGSVTIYCDNMEALRRRKTDMSTFTTLSRRDIDVKMEIEHMILTSPVEFSFQHVPGHADEDPNFVYSQALQQVQRNIDMHNLVTKFMQHPPRDLVPTSKTPFLPHQNIALLIHNKVIAGDIKNHIYMERHGLSMEERLSKHRNINHDFQHIIDWQALQLAFKKQDTLGRINVAKILHNLWPTMAALENRKTGVSGICPRCKNKRETVSHVFQCTHRSSTSAFREAIHRFQLKLRKLHTVKPIITAFTEFLLAFHHNRNPVCPVLQFGNPKKYDTLRRVFLNQQKLGLQAFHIGYISYKWSMVQSLYTEKGKKEPMFNVSWSSQIIQAIWDFSTYVWTKRCSIVHSKNPENASSLNDAELRESIRKYLRCQRKDLSPTEKSLHLNIASNIIRASSITLARWLHLLAEERDRTIRMKRTQQIRRGGTRPITGYFRRVASSNMGN